MDQIDEFAASLLIVRQAARPLLRKGVMLTFNFTK